MKPMAFSIKRFLIGPVIALGLVVIPMEAVAEKGSFPPSLVTEAMIIEATTYHGAQAEKKLKDLLHADYHYALALYHLGREKSGFMALERCELAFERAIGDIRESVFIKEEKERIKQVLAAFHNWQQAFQKARFKNISPS